jgi:hypothetical protein
MKLFAIVFLLSFNAIASAASVENCKDIASSTASITKLKNAGFTEGDIVDKIAGLNDTSQTKLHMINLVQMVYTAPTMTPETAASLYFGICMEN